MTRSATGSSAKPQESKWAVKKKAEEEASAEIEKRVTKLSVEQLLKEAVDAEELASKAEAQATAAEEVARRAAAQAARAKTVLAPTRTRAGTGHMYTGELRSLKEGQQYGFIICEELRALYGKDAWCPAALLSNVSVGSTVSFELMFNKKGQPQATNVTTVAEPTPEVPVDPDIFFGHWKDSMGHDIEVDTDSGGVIKAILTKPGGAPAKELVIHMDHDQKWRCGNGQLDDLPADNESETGKPPEIAWVTWNGKKSVWTREADESPAPEKADPDAWWKMTEEWEAEKGPGSGPTLLGSGQSKADEEDAAKDHFSAEAKVQRSTRNTHQRYKGRGGRQ